MRVAGQTCWDWVFHNSEVVIHMVRCSRGAGVVAEVLGGHRPALWVSDLYGAQRGHAADWQICLAHQLRDCAYAIEAGDAVFAPRMKALLLRAVVLARRSRGLAPSTRRGYRRRLECALDAVMALALTHRDGRRLRRCCGKLRSHLFTFLGHPELPADNNGSERELRPTATYRKVPAGSAPIGAPACAPSSASPRAVAPALTRLFSKPYAGRPSTTRVEQMPRLRLWAEVPASQRPLPVHGDHRLPPNTATAPCSRRAWRAPSRAGRSEEN